MYLHTCMLLHRWDEVEFILSGINACLDYNYANILFEYAKNGKSKKATSLLKKAIEKSPTVAIQILQPEESSPLPPPQFSYGEETEVYFAAFLHYEVWRTVKGALNWLASHLPKATLPSFLEFSEVSVEKCIKLAEKAQSENNYQLALKKINEALDLAEASDKLYIYVLRADYLFHLVTIF